MNDKSHQTSHTEYQVRIDGNPVFFSNIMDSDTINEWTKAAINNPDCYVDIAKVSVEIIVNQFTYNQLKKHFNNASDSQVLAKTTGVISDSDPISFLDLGNKITNALWNDGIKTIGNLLSNTPRELREIPNIGPGSIDKIAMKLKNIGYSLMCYKASRPCD